MICPQCGDDGTPKGARYCPTCGRALSEPAKPSVEITSAVKVGRVEGGRVAGVEVGQITGDVTVQSTVNQIEAKLIQGDYVHREAITNNILVLGPRAQDELLGRLIALLGVDERVLREDDRRALSGHVGAQIAEVLSAQKAAAAQGVPPTPQAAYRLGMLAAYRRDYDQAIDYFHRAARADPEFSEAFQAIAWLQQSRAMEDMQQGKYDAAVSRLAEARAAARLTDPLDPRALALRGYVAKTLAQIAEIRQNQADRQNYYLEAAQMFEQAARLEPTNASAQNGLGNVHFALGNLDAAIAAYGRAIELEPGYVSAYHDLALAYEDKMRADPAHRAAWRRKALRAWRKTYQLAPNDPSFSADYILIVGRRISALEQQGKR